MKKNQITESLLESLSGSINDKFTEKTVNLVGQVVSCAVQNLSEKNAFVVPEKCTFLAVNEAATGALSQFSEFDFFFGIDNPQIALNSRSGRFARLNWGYFWSEFKANFRVGKRKDASQKKNKKDKAEVKKVERAENMSITRYKITNLIHDMMNSMANFVTPTTVLYEKSDRVTIVGAEDFGTNVKINIYITIYDHVTKEFKLYNAPKNKFIPVNFGKRFETIEAKKKSCGEKNVLDMLKIFNALYAKDTNKVPNQILIESLVLGCPDSLFVDGDVYRTFVNLANYIRINPPRSFMSICDSQRSVFDEPLVVKNGSQAQYSRLVHILDEFKF